MKTGQELKQIQHENWTGTDKFNMKTGQELKQKQHENWTGTQKNLA